MILLEKNKIFNRLGNRYRKRMRIVRETRLFFRIHCDGYIISIAVDPKRFYENSCGRLILFLKGLVTVCILVDLDLKPRQNL